MDQIMIRKLVIAAIVALVAIVFAAPAFAQFCGYGLGCGLGGYGLGYGLGGYGLGYGIGDYGIGYGLGNYGIGYGWLWGLWCQ